ncbi:beta-galactosidase [Paenibacillus sp. NFR01]|uniref:beta-galactosidase n=1 Tax=Paenibacillus sp. NFR01 TaxID=1566279 RepID=UPI0008C18ED7|nr:beta-galactosidase [Paenibacillus sp. NFR01]SEU26127.1 Glycosyl hydrolases family 35 [Paenibacillus sp. NFR01]
MSEYRIDASDDRKNIIPAKSRMTGVNPAGERLGFSNYYMEKNGKPYFGICGEFHYSRYDERFWEDEILKMKMGGVNIIATYIFWNVHEEIQGQFDWTGRRDLRRFIELCARHGLYVIIRIGPFDHGEMRNGGMPDWLFGRPFEVRSNDEAYLAYVDVLYAQISMQVQGLLYKDGGPVIGTQIENEHRHSAAQWALTTGISNEWMTQGHDGEAHMLKLKEMAIAAGLDTPFYTCTAWGGASAPAEEMLPLWGGYSHWPWIYYEHDRFGEMKEHPATPEYIFRDKHNNEIPRSYNFEPEYTPEDYPYACCEMGGGMTPFYRYRFDFPYISVPAMTGIKTAEGCNLIGYYMYHGGSNPTGKRDVFLNDLATPKISYDFNACIGEFGQVRESYHRTRLQHYFFRAFEEWFCRTKTVLPGDTSQMDPHDVDTLRYAVRAADGSGLLFLNNYQDHAVTHDLLIPGGVTVQTVSEEIRFPAEGPLRLGKDGYAMLPYNFDLDGVKLKSATAQLVTRMEADGDIYYVFVAPKGMPAEYALETATLAGVVNGAADVREVGTLTILRPDAGIGAPIRLTTATGQRVSLLTLSDEESLSFWQTEVWGRERLLLTSASLLVSGDELKLEVTGSEETVLRVFPDFGGEAPLGALTGGERVERAQDGIFAVYRFRLPQKDLRFELKRVKNDKAVLAFPEDAFTGIKEALLQIEYAGDIGYAFIDGELINDNFSNGKTWEIGLKRFSERLVQDGMYLYISPIRRGSVVSSNTTMAGWSENAAELIAELGNISAVPVYELVLRKG